MNRFDKKFKKEAVQLVREEGQTVAAVSKKLGIHANTLYKWISQYDKHKESAFPGSGRLIQPEGGTNGLKKTVNALQKEIVILRRTVAELQEENIILKKATAILARQYNP